MLQNNIELDLKTKLIESGTTQTEVAEKVGVTLSYVNRMPDMGISTLVISFLI